MLNIHLTLHAEGTGNLEVGVTLAFGPVQQVGRKGIERGGLLQFQIGGTNVGQSLQKPLVDARQFVDAVDGISLAESLGNNQEPLVGRLLEGFVDIGHGKFLILFKAVNALPNHAQALLNGLFKGAADGHDFAHRLHA